MLTKRLEKFVSNLIRPAKRVVRFYNQRGTAEQWIKEGKNAIKWTRRQPSAKSNCYPSGNQKLLFINHLRLDQNLR
jgi:hypothetical protein